MVFHCGLKRVNVGMMNEQYIDIKRIAEVKGLKSTRSIRIAIQKGKYIAREVKVKAQTLIYLILKTFHYFFLIVAWLDKLNIREEDNISVYRQAY